MEFQVSLKPRARRDLAEIGNYIAKDNRDRAFSFCQELIKTALALSTFAERGQILRSRRNVRKMPYQNYLIIYQVDEKSRTVEVLRFWHAARNQRRMRLKEEALAYGNEPVLQQAQAQQ